MVSVEVVTPPATVEERERLANTAAQLTDTTEMVTLRIGRNGAEFPVPANLSHALRELMATLAGGDEVWLVPRLAALTPQQAADLLGVSRQALVRAMDAGLLPFTRVGGKRQIAGSDLLAYERERTQRREALRTLTQLSEEYGLYDG